MGLRGAPLAAVGVDIVVVTCSHRSLAMLSVLEEVQLGARAGDVREMSAWKTTMREDKYECNFTRPRWASAI